MMQVMEGTNRSQGLIIQWTCWLTVDLFQLATSLAHLEWTTSFAHSKAHDLLSGRSPEDMTCQRRISLAWYIQQCYQDSFSISYLVANQSPRPDRGCLSALPALITTSRPVNIRNAQTPNEFESADINCTDFGHL